MLNQSRRSFLKTKLTLAACMAAGLDVVSTRTHAANMQGYKALVCVYLAGGNDSFNMFVPRSQSAHADYADARQGLALSRASVLPVNPVSYSDGLDYGFHPSMPESQRLFGEGQLSVIANVGSLVRPVTKSEYQSGEVVLPSQLFSHNDQTDSWLSADARGGAGLGWAGKTMDIMYPNGAPQPSPSITIGGSSLWQTGQRVRPFEVGTGGVGESYSPYHRGPLKLRDAFRTMYRSALEENNLLVNEHASTLARAEAFGNSVNTALAFSPQFENAFPQGRLSDQLEMVARLIAIRGRLDSTLNRQVFFVRIGGWDTHNEQGGENYSRHAELLQELDTAMAVFQRAMVQLNVNNSVTTFTATEFGRTLIPNGSGTDHGWGGHNLVMGGAVAGGDIYGQMPQVSRSSVDSVNGGRFIPTSSVDQYSATMARWFGLNNSELQRVFPNLANFATSNMGFMV